MSYSSGSSSGHHVSLPGVPSKCWCGAEITTFTSKTKGNPYRRFYRCTIAMKREHEDHLFKWVDEALLDEIKMVDGKCKRVAEDVNDLKKEVMANIEFQTKIIKKLEEEMVKKMNVEEVGHVVAKSTLKAVTIAPVVVCSIVWLWGRV